MPRHPTTTSSQTTLEDRTPSRTGWGNVLRRTSTLAVETSLPAEQAFRAEANPEHCLSPWGASKPPDWGQSERDDWCCQMAFALRELLANEVAFDASTRREGETSDA